MDSVDIKRVEPGDSDAQREFIELPHRLYAADPHWVPMMRGDMARSLDRDRHPFFQAGEAAFFLTRRQGRPVGRLAALDNQRYNEVNQGHTGFFNFFECERDHEAAAGLFGAAFDWLRERKLDQVLGPKGLLPGDGNGMLVQGFGLRPAMGIAYNPDYYPAYVEAAGFEKSTDYFSGYLTSADKLPARIHRIVERVRKRRGYHVKQFRTKAELREWIPEIRHVYNESFRDSFSDPIGFVPLSEDDIQIIANRLLALAQPELIKLVFQRDDLIGFLFAYPNIGRAVRRAGGRLWPLGWLYMLIGLRTSRWLDVNGIGILPEHQGQGANGVLYVELEKTLSGSRFRHADMVQVREENLKSFTEAQALGVRWYKTHRLYRRSL